ncbi:MAG TPA: aromatic hydrocarbon degradation protein [Mesorhizobium sp.]|nr:aromatic hydrocarbon degradation protein [Mesorhizobium sp.]
MNNLRLKALLGAGCVSLAVAGTAQAGGFSRGTADTDILFDPGNFNMRAGVTYVTPHRDFDKNPVPGLVGTSYTDSYIIPSAAIKLNLSDNFRCAGTMVDNNGGAATYAVPKLSGKLIEDFSTNEKALTCGVKFQAGPGNFWLLGGGFAEDFRYHRENALRPLPGPNGSVALPNVNLDLEGQEFGYRIGAAYEIPEIAFRAQLMYRSGTDYGATGSVVMPTAALLGSQAQSLQAQAQAALAAGNLAQAQQLGAAAQQALQQAMGAAAAGLSQEFDAIGIGNLPQSVEFKLQSGIAPGWLAFGAIKWSDWSVQKELLVKTSNPAIGSEDIYNWRDGWTVTGGVAHAFNDSVSGLVSLTWDRGVGTGWDLSSDAYTLVLGGLVKDPIGGELRGGVGFSYLASASETAYFGANGEDQNQSVKAGYAVALNLGYNIRW